MYNNASSSREPAVTVFGASGHTGRFVVAELRRRGWTPILSGRDAAKLRAVAELHPGSRVAVAAVEDPGSLDRAIAGAAAVINCAGPFADTSAPVIEAALRARAHYLDVTAEQVVALATFEQYAARARGAGIVIAPAVAFYGGLTDLLATVAVGDWPAADDITIAIALDSWKPTQGTRLTGQRHAGRRFVFSGGRWQLPADPPMTARWRFPAPVGDQEVMALAMVDAAVIAHHLATPEIRIYMNLAPLAELRDPSTPGPRPADDRGRSAQTFLVEAVARRAGQRRSAIARGRDIYAITAPIVVEAMERILDGRCTRTGVVAPGEAFDARDVLRALAAEHLAFETDAPPGLAVVG